MGQTRKVAVLVGSLRKESYNRKLAHAMAKLAHPSLQFDFIEIGQLPLYNEDLDAASPPQEWVAFRQEIAGKDAVLFVTPEYNRSVPAVLKNALDVGSRPYGHSVWAKKPGAVISASPGNIGGFGANHHLRQSLVFLDVPILQAPEAYVSGVNKVFDEQGNLNNDGTRQFLQSFVNALAQWVEINIAGNEAVKQHAA